MSLGNLSSKDGRAGTRASLSFSATRVAYWSRRVTVRMTRSFRAFLPLVALLRTTSLRLFTSAGVFTTPNTFHATVASFAI